MDYKVGDIVEYETFLGGRRVVEITARHEEVKNGRPGFDGTIYGSIEEEVFLDVWGYDDQIIRVMRK